MNELWYYWKKPYLYNSCLPKMNIQFSLVSFKRLQSSNWSVWSANNIVLDINFDIWANSQLDLVLQYFDMQKICVSTTDTTIVVEWRNTISCCAWMPLSKNHVKTLNQNTMNEPFYVSLLNSNFCQMWIANQKIHFWIFRVYKNKKSYTIHHQHKTR